MSWLAPPLLGRPTDSSVTLNMVNEDAINVYVAVHTDPDSVGLDKATAFAVDVPPGVVIEDTLGGLAANTRYYYRLYYRPASDKTEAGFVAYSANGKDAFDFYTARAPGQTFQFTISSDEHGQDELEFAPGSRNKLWRLYQNVESDSADFHLTLGDLININGLCPSSPVCGTYATIEQANYYMRQQMEPMSAHVPLFFAIGNREHEEGWRFGDADSINAWAVRARLKAWPNPQVGSFYSGDTTQTIYGRRENYYAWEWGDALFVVLDPYWYTTTNPRDAPSDAWRWTLGDDQYEWVYATLTGSSAPWKLVFIHQLTSSTGGASPAFYGRGGAEIAKYSVYGWASNEWGGEDADGNNVYDTKRPGWSHGPIHDLLDTAGVQVVFKGHDHGYCYQDQLAPPLYVTVPKAIQRNSTYALITPTYYPDTANNVRAYTTGHLRVTVFGADSLMCEYVRAVLAADEPLVEGEDSVYNQTVSHKFIVYP